VLKQLAHRATRYQLPACVISFEPLPQEFFLPTTAPARLSCLADKIRVLTGLGIERLLLLRFNCQLADLTADDFINRILVRGLGVKHLVVGDDFRFGKGRAGDFDLLTDAGQQYGFEVAPMDTYQIDGERVSSTRIRKLLEAGDMDGAAALLGRYFQIRGRVGHGDKRGRDIGFPTANIHLKGRRVPLQGVYAVEAEGRSGECHWGVANIGVRPTVGGTLPLLEAHLFEFHGELYGQCLAVRFLHKIRDERRFNSLNALIRQIRADAADAQEFLQRRKGTTQVQNA
jgi:riboflavin kinase/FMN adenylyltransferase